MMIEHPGKTASQARGGSPATRGVNSLHAAWTVTARSIEDCQLIAGDFLKVTEKLPLTLFRLAFLDPIYNLGFRYDADPTRSARPKDYARLMRYVVEQQPA